MKEVVSVAVVGAGAAGLSAIKLLTQEDGGDDNDDVSTRFEVTGFEQDGHVGGVWAYTDRVGTQDNGLPVHASMYKHLRTNLPKECMYFPDQPFPSHLPSYPSHRDVLKYLEDYAQTFHLRKHIQFNTMVEHIKPVSDPDHKFGLVWEVTTATVANKMDKKTHTFDAVLVANGATEPLLPTVKGLERFEGEVIHSHDYREPSAYTNKTVLVLGGQSSGLDICVDTAGVATKVYLCYNTPKLKTILPSNVETRPGIKQCQGHNTVELLNGSTVQVDAIILCTGYHYNFRFLDDSIGVKVEDLRVTPLFKHFLPIGFPTLGLLGIPRHNIFFPLFYVQNKYFKSILNGTGTFPSESEMREDEERDFAKQLEAGKPPRYAHHLDDQQFDYFDSLAELGHFQRLPRTIATVYLTNRDYRSCDVTSYRNNNFLVKDDGTVEVLKPF